MSDEHPMAVIAHLESELRTLRQYAQGAFDAAGNGNEALGMALVDLGLVLHGGDPNNPAYTRSQP